MVLKYKLETPYVVSYFYNGLLNQTRLNNEPEPARVVRDISEFGIQNARKPP